MKKFFLLFERLVIAVEKLAKIESVSIPDNKEIRVELGDVYAEPIVVSSDKDADEIEKILAERSGGHFFEEDVLPLEYLENGN